MNFLEFKECAGCGKTFSIRTKHARKAKWCSEKCRKNTAYGGRCADCGATTSGSNGREHAPKRCRACERNTTALLVRRAKREDRWRRIQSMWLEGSSMIEIADALDTTVNALGGDMWEMRGEGWALPHRYNMRAGKRVAA